MIERVIILDAVDPVAFYGVNNANVQLIKNLFPKVRIAARGNVMKVIGDEKETEVFEEKIKLLEKHCAEYNQLSEEVIIDIIKGDEPQAIKPQENLIIYGVNGKPITGRTPNQKKLVEAFAKNDLTFALGPAGSGKTYVAIALAVKALKNKEVKKIILSRPSPVFLQRLFEMEVPEINDGLITIKKIARIPGERAKIAVESYDDRIDPVGACVGVKGSRIHGIVRELRNENIDVINYTSNIQLFIQRALSPAKISSIRLNEEERKAEVFLKPEEVSLAIGKGGLNIKLASMLTEYTIDVFRELDEAIEDEDIYLDEFRDEIDGWVIDAIKAIGIDTAKAVLNAPREMLIEKTDLEEETVDEVLRILKQEFEEEEQ